MRRRILAVVSTTTVLAVVVFGVPLAVVLQRLVVADERSELESLALQAATTVSAPGLTGADPVELPTAEDGVALGVYDKSGALVVGDGPAVADAAVDDAAARRIVTDTIGGELVVAVPVSTGEQVVAVARAATQSTTVWSRVALMWAAMLGAAVLAVALTWLLAARQTRRLAVPLERLAQRATDLGDGDFAQRAQTSGIEEIDAAGRALDRTARRLGAQVERERAVTAHASHQLRTPLTSLRLLLESALADTGDEALRPAAIEAVVATELMSRTIDDLLELAREERQNRGTLDLPSLFEELRDAWTGSLSLQDRPLRLRVDDPPSSSADGSAVRQILNVLLDNASRHGTGTVTVVGRDAGDALALDVIDEGSSDQAFDAEAGIGLGFARDLALSQGGRIVHSDRAPTRITVYLPTRGFE